MASIMGLIDNGDDCVNDNYQICNFMILLLRVLMIMMVVVMVLVPIITIMVVLVVTVVVVMMLLWSRRGLRDGEPITAIGLHSVSA